MKCDKVIRCVGVEKVTRLSSSSTPSYFYDYSPQTISSSPFIVEGLSAKILAWPSPEMKLTDAVKLSHLKGPSEIEPLVCAWELGGSVVSLAILFQL